MSEKLVNFSQVKSYVVEYLFNNAGMGLFTKAHDSTSALIETRL